MSRVLIENIDKLHTTEIELCNRRNRQAKMYELFSYSS